MKKLLLFLLIIPGLCVGQVNIDSLSLKVKTMEIKYDNDIRSLRRNMKYSHRQFQAGWPMCIIGMVAIASTAFFKTATGDEGSTSGLSAKTKNLIIGGGCLMNFAGIIIMIDSHKFIGRAGEKPTIYDDQYYKRKE